MNAINQYPDILENIFYHLSARDLSNCAQVCKLWSSLSAIEFKRRRSVAWFFQVDNEGYELGNYTEDEMMDKGDFESELNKHFMNMKIKPSFCLAFLSFIYSGMFEECLNDGIFELEFGKKIEVHSLTSIELHSKTKDNENIESVIKRMFHKKLPASTTTSFAVARGIIGSYSDYKTREVEEDTAICGFCFPKIPGVEIYDFSLKNSNCNMSKLMPHKSVKCLLVFVLPFGSFFLRELIQSCQMKEGDKVAVGGAVVKHTQSYVGTAVAFCGEKIEASSVIINVNGGEPLKDKLKIFQETGLLKYPCFAFMFACDNSELNQDSGSVTKDFQSLTFRSLYPQVPLIGMFGNGVVGDNYIPNVAIDNTNDRYYHSKGTVFVLVAIKDT